MENIVCDLDSMFDDVRISADIWPEILKRVPAIHLGKCRCVCKSWNSLIKSPYFITCHTKFSQKHLLLRHITLTPGFKQEHFTLCVDAVINPTENSHGQNLGYPPVKTFFSHFRVVGSINGLICLSDDLYPHPDTESCIVLWNPVVCRYIELSRPREKLGDVSILGFGFDSQKNDYKVVHLRYINGGKNYDITPPDVKVYSVRERAWKSVPADYVHCCIVDNFGSQCYLNGAVHWLAYERGKDHGFRNNTLLLFDVESEMFKKMKFPEALVGTCPLLLSVSELRGQMSVMEYQMKEGERSQCNIWVKKEYTTASSWSKVVSVKLEGWLGEVLRLRENGRLLCVARDGRFVSYDPKRKCIIMLGRGWPQGFYVADYTQSLVLLDKESGAISYSKTNYTRAEAGKRKWSRCDETALLMYEDDRFANQMDKLGQAFFDAFVGS